MKSSRQLHPIAALFLLVALAVVGCSNTSNPTFSRTPKGPSATTNGSNKDAETPQTVKTTAAEFVKAFSEDKAATEKKYENQTIEVTGEVDRTRGNEDDASVNRGGLVILHGYKRPEQLTETTLMCGFEVDSKTRSRIPDLKVGQKVTIKGKFAAAFSGFIELRKCELIDE